MSYPPIYIISLKRTPERRLSISRQLDAFNLQHQFIDGIDKFDLHSQAYREAIADQLDIDEQQLDYFFKKYHKSDLGLVACSLSHIKAYDLMIKNNISRVCVLEDDARLLPTFPQILAESQVFLRDIIMFGHLSGVINAIFKEYTRGFRSKAGKRSIRNIFSIYACSISNYACNISKLIRYKKYYPQLPLYMVYSIFLAIVRGAFLRFLKSKKARTNSRMSIVKIGGIPSLDKSPRYRFSSKHSLINPWPAMGNGTSGMGYMLTRSAAIKWKQATMDLRVAFDIVHGVLYCRGDLDLLIVHPPCIMALPAYTHYRVHTN
ncbi:MAG: glycosyltransferase family 25 protein [Chromatiales bacterium]|nr:glycosyltransferase family 25 protein [Chromatiales bacterium]